MTGKDFFSQLVQCPVATVAWSQPGWSQELHPGLPRGRQGPGTEPLSAAPMHFSRELDRKQSSWDSNQQSDVGRQPGR